MQDVAEDEVLLRIPLRLAVVSRAHGKELNAALGHDFTHEERLAWKLLQHVEGGPDSLLHPYIQVCFLQKQLTRFQLPTLMSTYCCNYARLISKQLGAHRCVHTRSQAS